MMTQAIFNVSGIVFGTYALIPQKTKYSQVSRKILGTINEGRVFGLYRGKEQTFISSYMIQNWNSICVTADMERPIPLKIFLNGDLQETTSDINVVDLHDKDTNFFKSSDYLWNSFIGSVTDFHIWNKTLSVLDIKSFSRCDLRDNLNKVFDWNQAEFNAKENADVITIDTEDICTKEPRYIHIASNDKKNYFASLDYCSDILGGDIAVIENDTLISQMTAAFKSLADWESICFVRFWNGYTKHKEDKYYINPITNKRIDTIKWIPDEPRSLDSDEYCPMYDINSKASINKECIHMKCPICRVPLLKKYMLRGVCTEQTWLADTYYYLKQEKLFMGNMHSKITWDKNRWELQKLSDSSTIAFMNETSNYPLGVHKWFFEETICRDQEVIWRKLILHLEVEQPGKFCCDDGACIDSELVCDANQHCDDNTDEENCSLIQLNANYNSKRAPSLRIKKMREIEFTEATVTFSIYIYDLMEINQDDATFTILFLVSKTWKDQRLSFNFLKANTTNGIAQNFSNVWIPQFTYSITHNIEQVNFNLFVKKEDTPLLNGGLDLLHPKGSNSIIARTVAFKIQESKSVIV